MSSSLEGVSRKPDTPANVSNPLSEGEIFKSPLVQALLDQLPGASLKTDWSLSFPISKKFKDDGKHIIAGYASVEVIDTQDELIPISVLKDAWENFQANKSFYFGSLMHSNVPVLKILDEYKDSKGQVWKSGVDENGLFIVGEIRQDIQKGRQTWELIEKGKLTGFSIGGETLASSTVCEGKCFTRIEKMELHEVAVVDRPANKPSVFKIVKRDGGLGIEKIDLTPEIKAVGSITADEIKEKIKALKRQYNIISEKVWPTSPKTKLTDEQVKQAKLQMDFLEAEMTGWKQALGIKLAGVSLIESSTKIDKALNVLNEVMIEKKVIRRGNKYCVIHCHGPKAGQIVSGSCKPTRGEAEAIHRAIMANKALEKQKPPKEEWDACHSKASGIPSINDPDAFCGNLWYNDKPKWNAFIKADLKAKEDCGCKKYLECPVDQFITTSKINKLDLAISSLLSKGS